MLTQIMRYSDPFMRLRKSRFRRDQHLNKIEREIVDRFGLAQIREDAYRMIRQNLNNPAKDGRQTPRRGHPVFVAQHATATCCRRCLFKWHRIPFYRDLTMHEEDFIVNMIIRWIAKEVSVFC